LQACSAINYNNVFDYINTTKLRVHTRVALISNKPFHTRLLPKIFEDTEVDFVTNRKTVKSTTSEFNNTNGVAHHPYRYVLFTLP